ncbi:MAG: hypothetical protein N4Q91_07835, partial [Lactobacillus crispatus]|nr:hypothetical protein [Lactobacillus crispatus]
MVKDGMQRLATGIRKYNK